ncbi:hypothetical protein RJT34_17984 [Clitoria ternatea]|uniref:Uncharacterized protein n=1 Tax=Clitoria ternatea TaxID=43366 RepID=A0AAN9JBG0_CLITE
MEDNIRILERHVEDLTYLELTRLTFKNTSASTKRVVITVSHNPGDEIIKLLCEEIDELRREHSTPAKKVSHCGHHQLKASRLKKVDDYPYPKELANYLALSIGKYTGETNPGKHLDAYVYKAMFSGVEADAMCNILEFSGKAY